ADFQKLRVIGAVWLMAVRAVLDNRRMLPQEWTAAFGVAAETVLVGRCLDQLLGVWCPVRIVAARTGNFAFAIRHVRRALQLGAPHLVALQAQLRLRFLDAEIFREW